MHIFTYLYVICFVLKIVILILLGITWYQTYLAKTNEQSVYMSWNTTISSAPRSHACLLEYICIWLPQLAQSPLPAYSSTNYLTSAASPNSQIITNF